jgi:hypothetical protein
VDPEVVIQFISLQQTGKFSPALSNGATMQQAAIDALFALAGSQGNNLASLLSPATISASISSAQQPAVDALFALAGIPDNDWALLETLTP